MDYIARSVDQQLSAMTMSFWASLCSAVYLLYRSWMANGIEGAENSLWFVLGQPSRITGYVDIVDSSKCGRTVYRIWFSASLLA